MATFHRWVILALGALLICACKTTPKDPAIWPVKLEGKVDVNGKPVTVSIEGSLNTRTGAYELPGAGSTDATVNPREKLLLTIIPRAALAFARLNGRESLIEQAGGKLEVSLTARRKVDTVSKLTATVRLSSEGGRLAVRYDGALVTPTGGDRDIEPDGEAVLRAGVNPRKGNLTGVVRVNYDIQKPDPASLGTADFWNLDGKFSASAAGPIYAHVDRCGGDPSSGLAKGTVLHFPSSTVFESGIITLSGVAKKDGVIHQFKGIANQAGGGQTILTFPVRIKKGMTAAQVAQQIEAGFTKTRTEKIHPLAQYVLAVQGGDGVSRTEPDRTSPRVAISMTLDGSSIARPADSAGLGILDHSATQSFSDQQVTAAENTGVRNQFGVIGQAPLNGWLTPFKAVFSTDNPATGNLAAGGQVAILLNWTERVPGAAGAEGSTTAFDDLVVPTQKGETADQIATRLTDAIKQRRTKWGSTAFTQRLGNVLYIDAGIDFPHSVSLASTDPGVGYMSAAADLPAFAK